MRFTVDRIEISPLSVPLIEPFVIASGSIETTRAVLVQVTLIDGDGRREVGLGEAAALPPVTTEDQQDLLLQLTDATGQLRDASFVSLTDLTRKLDRVFDEQPVSRAGMECALLDAWARLRDMPLCTLLSGAPPRSLVTDMTLPISAPEHMARLAVNHRARGFSIFKVKIGKSLEHDIEALMEIAKQVPDATFRLDANAGFNAGQALRVLAACKGAGLHVECFEQPCGRTDLTAMARVTEQSEVPIVADESVRSMEELERVHAAHAATAVNLKLVKSGGLISCFEIGQRARELGMRVMCGGMVETRLGMTAMGHVACALGGVDYVDLDTAFLLASDPFIGGYQSRGAALSFGTAPGLGLSLVD